MCAHQIQKGHIVIFFSSCCSCSHTFVFTVVHMCQSLMFLWQLTGKEAWYSTHHVYKAGTDRSIGAFQVMAFITNGLHQSLTRAKFSWADPNTACVKTQMQIWSCQENHLAGPWKLAIEKACFFISLNHILTAVIPPSMYCIPTKHTICALIKKIIMWLNFGSPSYSCNENTLAE